MNRFQSRLESAIPESFPFYHLGEIALAPSGAFAPGELEDQDALGFSLRGDLHGMLVILISKGLDLSVYAEAGNLIASRLATELARKDGLDVMISPPHALSPAALQPMAASVVLERTYLHKCAGTIVPVRMLILTDNQSNQGAANA